MRRVVAARACLCCLIAFVATGCATPPAVKRDYLDATAWRGSALTGVGRQMVVDAAAGAAPQTVTLIDVNARAEVAGDVGAARSHSEPASGECANGTAPQRNCARHDRRVARRRLRAASRPIRPANCRQSKWWSSRTIDRPHARRRGRMLKMRCRDPRPHPERGVIASASLEAYPGCAPMRVMDWIVLRRRFARPRDDVIAGGSA